MTLDRWRFAGKYMLVCLLAMLLPAYGLFRRWYPADWVPFVNGRPMLWIAVAAGRLGPVLGGRVYKKNRRLLALDVTILTALQLVTLGFAVYGMFQGRPVWAVFVKDDFSIVRQVDIRPQPSLSEASILKGPQWIGARFSDDPAIRDKQMNDDLSGIRLEVRPSAHVALDVVRDELKAAAQPLKALEQFNAPASVAQALTSTPGAATWLPLKGYDRDGVVLLDKMGVPLRPVELAPWN
jgi:hypothetical protein